MPANRVAELLREATQRLREADSETPRLDAELLLGHVLRLDRASLIAHPDARVGDGQLAAYEQLLARREAGEPVAYIRGLKEFYGLAFQVDDRALIPRPETELLVNLGLARLTSMLTGQPRPPDSPPIHVWDIGTGCGAIIVALAVESRRRGYATELRFTATDLSEAALGLAIENAAAHAVADMIDFAVADLAEHPDGRVVELILANLPYVPSSEVPELPVAATFEPTTALDGGADGLELIRHLLAKLPTALLPGGMCMVEIGADQASLVQGAAEQLLSGWPLGIEQDLAGEPRVAQLVRPPGAR